MASNFGAPFVESSFEPLRVAATKLAEGHLSEGLEALSRRRLQESFEQGIDATARSLRVPRDMVIAALPLHEVGTVLEEVDRCQQRARGSVGQFVGTLGSLLPGAGPPEPASRRLGAVADKYALDEHIAVPFSDLSAAVARWEDLLHRASAGLAGDRAIRGVVWRRRLMWIGLAAVVSLVLASALTAGAWHHVVVTGAQERIAAVVGQHDPCQVEQVRLEDREHATAEQIEKLASMRKQCDEVRQREAYVSACVQLADHVAAGRLHPEDKGAAKSAHALLERVATGAMTPQDLTVDGDEMPCADTPSHDRLWKTFADRAASAPELWGKVESISPFVRDLLKRKDVELSQGARETLLHRVDDVTERAIKKGLEPELDRARRLCALADSIALPKTDWCKALARIDAKK